MWIVPVPVVVVAAASLGVALPMVAAGVWRRPPLAATAAVALTALFSFRVGYADVIYFAAALLPLLVVARAGIRSLVRAVADRRAPRPSVPLRLIHGVTPAGERRAA